MSEKLFSGKVAIITGGRMGIGSAIVEKFVEKGCNVAVFGRTQAKGMTEESRESGEPAVRFYSCDVAEEEQVKNAVADVIKDFGKIDFLVNNAGIYPAVPFLEMDTETFDQIFDINVKGIFLVTKEVVRQSMQERKQGKIICISSVDGWLPSKGIIAYAASKAAVNSMVKSFAIELAEYHITANGVAPGWVATEPVLKAERWKSQIGGVLKGRMAEPQEIGEMVTFLCEERADYMNGEIVNLSGGLLLNA